MLLELLVKAFALYGAWRAVYSVWRNYFSPIPSAFPGFDKGNFVVSLPMGLYDPIVHAFQRAGLPPVWNASTKFARRAMWRNGLIINSESEKSLEVFGPGKTCAITRVSTDPGYLETVFVRELVMAGTDKSKIRIHADFDPEIPKGAMTAVTVEGCPLVFIFRKPGIAMGNPPKLVRKVGF